MQIIEAALAFAITMLPVNRAAGASPAEREKPQPKTPVDIFQAAQSGPRSQAGRRHDLEAKIRSAAEVPCTPVIVPSKRYAFPHSRSQGGIHARQRRHPLVQKFRAEIQAAIAGTPLSVDMVAIACQETGPSGRGCARRTDRRPDPRAVRRRHAGCRQGPGRAFPQDKAALLAKPRGKEMFAIARQALVDMARARAGFAAVANPDKFCHGFGLFQLDLQFFRVEPDYFLEKRYEKFERTLGSASRS